MSFGGSESIFGRKVALPETLVKKPLYSTHNNVTIVHSLLCALLTREVVGMICSPNKIFSTVTNDTMSTIFMKVLYLVLCAQVRAHVHPSCLWPLPKRGRGLHEDVTLDMYDPLCDSSVNI